MGFRKPGKYLQSTLSWTHLIRSKELRFAYDYPHIPVISVYGSGRGERRTAGEGIFPVSSSEFKIDSILKKIPPGTAMVYGGYSVCRNLAYENQLSMLALLADSSLFTEFRDFSEKLVHLSEEMTWPEDPSEAFIVEEKPGKFRFLPSNDYILGESRRDWIEKVSKYLDDPFSDDPCLSYPEAFGLGALQVTKKTWDRIHISSFQLSHTRYFNLSEMQELEKFVKGKVKQRRGFPVFILSSSMFVEYYFAKKCLPSEKEQEYSRSMIEKWMFGFEPYLSFFSAFEGCENGGLIINLTNLPYAEVISFEA